MPEKVPSDSILTLTVCLKFMGLPMSISRVEEEEDDDDLCGGCIDDDASMVRLRGRPPPPSQSGGEDRCLRKICKDILLKSSFLATKNSRVKND